MGLTVLDAGVLIGFLDADDAHHEAAYRALEAASRRGDHLAVPASAYAETLVGPARRGAQAVQVVTDLLDRLPVEVVSIDAAIARTAAALRARLAPRLKLPDAFVIATADVLDADTLVTSDRGWPARRALGLRARIVQL